MRLTVALLGGDADFASVRSLWSRFPAIAQPAAARRALVFAGVPARGRIGEAAAALMIDTCLFGDCRESMRELIAQGVRVQTCVSSPPYWGLRDYGTATWEGGEVGCDHVEQYTHPMLGACSGGVTNRRPDLELQQTASQSGRKQFRDLCGKCNARRIDSQLGLESTPEEYVANIVEVFRLVRELLADDGTLWLNLGDSYAAGKTGRADTGPEDLARRASAYGTGTGIGYGAA